MTFRSGNHKRFGNHKKERLNHTFAGWFPASVRHYNEPYILPKLAGF